MAEKDISIIEWIARHAQRHKEMTAHSEDLPSLTIPDAHVVQLAGELADRFHQGEPRAQLMNLITSVRDHGDSLEHLKRVLAGTYVYGVRLDFEHRMNGKHSLAVDPNALVNSFRLANGLEFLRYASGRIGVRMGEAYVAEISRNEWESIIAAMGEQIYEESA